MYMYIEVWLNIHYMYNYVHVTIISDHVGMHSGGTPLQGLITGIIGTSKHVPLM